MLLYMLFFIQNIFVLFDKLFNKPLSNSQTASFLLPGLLLILLFVIDYCVFSTGEFSRTKSY